MSEHVSEHMSKHTFNDSLWHRRAWWSPDYYYYYYIYYGTGELGGRQILRRVGDRAIRDTTVGPIRGINDDVQQSNNAMIL